MKKTTKKFASVRGLPKVEKDSHNNNNEGEKEGGGGVTRSTSDTTASEIRDSPTGSLTSSSGSESGSKRGTKKKEKKDKKKLPSKKADLTSEVATNANSPGIRAGTKRDVRISYTVAIGGAAHLPLPLFEGKDVVVRCGRMGTTSAANVKSGAVSWPEEKKEKDGEGGCVFTFETSLIQYTLLRKWEEKTIKFRLFEQGKGTSKDKSQQLKFEVNVGDQTISGNGAASTHALKAKRLKSAEKEKTGGGHRRNSSTSGSSGSGHDDATLLIRIKAEWKKVNGQAIIEKKEDASFDKRLSAKDKEQSRSKRWRKSIAGLGDLGHRNSSAMASILASDSSAPDEDLAGYELASDSSSESDTDSEYSEDFSSEEEDDDSLEQLKTSHKKLKVSASAQKKELRNAKKENKLNQKLVKNLQERLEASEKARNEVSAVAADNGVQGQLAAKEREMEELKERTSKMMADIEKLAADVSEKLRVKEEEHNQLMKEHDALKVKLSASQSTAGSLGEIKLQLAEKAMDLEQRQAEVAAAAKQLEKSNKKIKKQSRQLEDVKADRDRQAKEAQSAREELERMQKRSKDNSSESESRNQSEIAKLKETLRANQEALVAKEQEWKKADREREDAALSHSKELEGLKEQVVKQKAEMERAVSAKQQEIDAITQKSANLQAENDALNKKIVSIQADKGPAKSFDAKLEAAARAMALDAKKSMSIEDKLEAASRAMELDSKISDQQQRSADADYRLAEKEKELLAEKEQARQLKKQIEELNARVAQQAQELSVKRESSSSSRDSILSSAPLPHSNPLDHAVKGKPQRQGARPPSRRQRSVSLGRDTGAMVAKQLPAATAEAEEEPQNDARPVGGSMRGPGMGRGMGFGPIDMSAVKLRSTKGGPAVGFAKQPASGPGQAAAQQQNPAPAQQQSTESKKADQDTAKLEALIKEQKEQIATMEQTVAALTAAKESAEKESQQQREEIAKITQDIREKADVAKDGILQLESKLKEAQEDAQAKAKKCEEFEADVARLQQEISTLLANKIEVEILREKIAKAEDDQRAVLASREIAIEAKDKEAEQEQARVTEAHKKELDAAQAKHLEIEEKLRSQTALLEKKQSIVDEKEQALSFVQESVAQKDKEIEALRAESEKQAEAKTREINLLKEQIVTLEKNDTESREEGLRLKNQQIADLEQQIAAAQQRVKQAEVSEAKLKAQEERISELKAERKKQKALLGEKQAVIDDKEQALALVQASVAQKENELAAIRAESEKQAETKTREVNLLKEQIAVLEKSGADVQEEGLRLKNQQIADLEQQVAAAQQKIKQAEEDSAAKNQQSDLRLSDLERERKKQIILVEEKQTALVDKEQALALAQESIAQKDKEMAALRAESEKLAEAKAREINLLKEQIASLEKNDADSREEGLRLKNQQIADLEQQVAAAQLRIKQAEETSEAKLKAQEDRLAEFEEERKKREASSREVQLGLEEKQQALSLAQANIAQKDDEIAALRANNDKQIEMKTREINMLKEQIVVLESGADSQEGGLRLKNQQIADLEKLVAAGTQKAKQAEEARIGEYEKLQKDKAREIDLLKDQIAILEKSDATSREESLRLKKQQLADAQAKSEEGEQSAVEMKRRLAESNMLEQTFLFANSNRYKPSQEQEKEGGLSVPAAASQLFAFLSRNGYLSIEASGQSEHAFLGKIAQSLVTMVKRNKAIPEIMCNALALSTSLEHLVIKELQKEGEKDAAPGTGGGETPREVVAQLRALSSGTRKALDDVNLADPFELGGITKIYEWNRAADLEDDDKEGSSSGKGQLQGAQTMRAKKRSRPSILTDSGGRRGSIDLESAAKLRRSASVGQHHDSDETDMSAPLMHLLDFLQTLQNKVIYKAFAQLLDYTAHRELDPMLIQGLLDTERGESNVFQSNQGKGNNAGTGRNTRAREDRRNSFGAVLTENKNRPYTPEDVTRVLTRTLRLMITGLRTDRPASQIRRTGSSPLTVSSSSLPTSNAPANSSKSPRLTASIVQFFFIKVFEYIDAALFNSLVDRAGEVCRCGWALRAKLGIATVSDWTLSLPLEFRPFIHGAATRNALAHIDEATNVMVMSKQLFTDESAIKDAFPALAPIQIMHILYSFKPDELSPEGVPEAAKQLLRRMVTRAGHATSVKLDII